MATAQDAQVGTNGCSPVRGGDGLVGANRPKGDGFVGANRPKGDGFVGANRPKGDGFVGANGRSPLRRGMTAVRPYHDVVE
jgi:hypothetical protein